MSSPKSSFDIELWSRSERDKEVGRRKGIRDCSLFSFVFLSFRLRGILRKTYSCNSYAKWGVVSLKAPLRGISHRSPVLTAGRVKTGIVVHGLYVHKGLNSFFQLNRNQLHQAEDEVLF